MFKDTIVYEEEISPEEVHACQDDKRYKLTTIIPIVEKPKKIIREVTQEQLDYFLDEYNTYAEFVIEIVEIF